MAIWQVDLSKRKLKISERDFRSLKVFIMRVGYVFESRFSAGNI